MRNRRVFTVLVVLGFLGCPPQGTDPPELVSIAAGTFEMGDPWDEGFGHETPVHTVNLSAYQIGKYEVTNQEVADVYNWADDQGYFDTVNSDTASAHGEELLDMDDGVCQISYSGGQFTVESRDGHSMADHPVVEISWYAAAMYCNWLSEIEGREQCYDTSAWECDFTKAGYRLPTEAEWERAAAWDPAQERHYRYGNGSDSISCGTVNFRDGSSVPEDCCNPLGLSDKPYTSPVGYYTGVTSPAGCYNMSGNVYEWCNDWWKRDYTEGSVSDPHGPSTGDCRVLRGGSWTHNSSRHCRAAIRHWNNPRNTCHYHGFRVVLAAPLR